MAATLGQHLVEKGLIDESQLAQAVESQKVKRQFLGAYIQEQGWVDPEQLLEAVGDFYQMRCVHLQSEPINREAVDQLPSKVALHYKVMPVDVSDGTLTVAISNPQDIRLVDDLRLAIQQKFAIETVLAGEADINTALNKAYGVGMQTVSEIMEGQPKSKSAKSASPADGIEELDDVSEDASVVKLVNQLILDAHQKRATDIHFEPFRGRVRLRYRIDGILQSVDVPEALSSLYPAMVSRVKVLSNLNIVERRLPQDGRASVRIGNQKLDLRIATIPTSSGESVVIRILPSQMLIELKDLGYSDEDLAIIEKNINKPNGLIFVTGPTGSGKTTTLYACLKRINGTDRKIMTIEDPVEYELEGITQVQVKPDIGLDFAAALRSMLRHDPDVMMVGEVRDVETVELAVRIALTGHLLFSTLHTNDAVSALVRLTDMGVDPYLIASSAECIIAQRLVRVLCENCKKPTPESEQAMLGPMHAPGCESCSDTGFKGRLAIYEILTVTAELRKLILEKASLEEVRRAASAQGMRSMREHGMSLVQKGLTTVEEIIRLTHSDEKASDQLKTGAK